MHSPRNSSARPTAIAAARRGIALVVCAIGLAVGSPRAIPTSINLSRDLVSLGIAGQNLVPDNPALDARPLFQAGLQYALAQHIPLVTVDRGAYYFLSRANSQSYIALFSASDLTIDLGGSTLYFGTGYYSSFACNNCQRITLTNFQLDYVTQPYTQVQVTAVNAAARRISYAILPGWPDPTSLNSVVSPFGIESYVAAGFRGGAWVPGTAQMLMVTPISGGVIQLANDGSPKTDPTTLALFQPGDTIAVTARGGSAPILFFGGDSIVLSNATIYGSSTWAIDFEQLSNSTADRVQVRPRPGGLIGSNADGIHFSSARGNNHLRNCYVARTLDDAIAIDSLGVGTVIAKTGARQLQITRFQYSRFPNGTPLNMFDPTTTLESIGGIVTSQNPLDSIAPAFNGVVNLVFDRDLPSVPNGTKLAYGSADLRGGGSTIEDCTVEDPVGRGIWISGNQSVSILRNRIGPTGSSGIAVQQDTQSFPGPPAHDITIDSNVLTGNLGPIREASGSQSSLGSIEVVSTGVGFALSPNAANSNVVIRNNWIVDSGRTGIWIGELNGGTVQNNVIVRPGRHPELATWGLTGSDLALVLPDFSQPIATHFSTNLTIDGNITAAPFPIGPPTSLVAIAMGTTGVRLTWSPPLAAASYVIKRGTVSGGETVVASGVTSTSFTDSTAVRGQRYFYVVSAVFDVSESINSNEVVVRSGVATGDVNGDGFADLIWRNTASGSNVAWYLNGTSVAGQINLPTVTDPSWQLVAREDIDNDGHLDLIWRNTLTGANVVWFMNGGTFLGQGNFPTVADPAWQLVASADIDQDTHPDLIWRNRSSGANAVWYFNGTSFLGQGSFPTVADPTWLLAASADMTQDGWPDLIWRNMLTGANVVWALNGTSLLGQATLPAVPDPTWRLMTAEDINQDGRPDLIWRNTLNGADVVWYMNGSVFSSQANLPAVADPTWQLLGAIPPEIAFDVNGDRHPDLMWRNAATGANLVWYLNGATQTGQAGLPTVADVTWQIVARADVNGDTHPDVIWRNTASGANVVWYLNGATLLGQGNLPSVADPNWRIVGAADLNADTHPDVVWRNASTGANVVWFLNGVSVLGQASVTGVPDVSWQIMAIADVDGDTRPDLIWRNVSNGANLVWYLNATTLLGQASLRAVADLGWQIATAADLNSDGHPDLIWRHTASGANVVWYLNGTSLLGQESLPTVSDPTWALRSGG